MTVSNTVLYIIIGIWVLSAIRSILIMFGKKVFKDARINPKNASYPILNLFTMLEAVDASSYMGILFFIPVINLIPLVIMSIRLGKVYNCESGFKLGLIFLPIVFYPSLFSSTRNYKERDNATFKANDSAKSESINLMTEEEIKLQNDSPYALDPAVDSIFKSHIEEIESAEPYRAAKIDKDVLDKLNDLKIDDSDFAPIKMKENASYFDSAETVEETTNNSNENDSKFTEQIKKDDSVEFIDL